MTAAHGSGDRKDKLLRRWGVSPEARAWIGGNNLPVRGKIEAIVSSQRAGPGVPIQCAFIAPMVTDEALYFTEKLRSRFRSPAAVWVVWPATDRDGLAALSEEFRDIGFEEIGSVDLSPEIVTLGFRAP